ncbi:hypothetical protein HUO14_02635 [Parasphingorhabdus flavimaris]|uniref:Uncharacterized protein n=1 Tax=Parasphingorhabdus flavimaris TaxID=266812 RepID=A0ABX2MZI7_9SPHN|nr:hypothetical protein [Parasphingorhabdus flavimaris]NVD26801.1 hypothetical protein [Parasphingorhabdus flavimaris]
MKDTTYSVKIVRRRNESGRVAVTVEMIANDWISSLGFDWAFSFPGAMRGIVFMEAIASLDRLGHVSQTGAGNIPKIPYFRR